MEPDEPSASGSSRAPLQTLAVGLGDRELVAAVLQKDRKAAAQLVAAHVDAVYSYVRHRLLPCADLVDDLVQDVFLAVLSSLPAFRGTSPLRAWILGIARHKVEDFYRARLRAPDSLEELEAAGAQPATEEAPAEDAIDAERSRARVRSVLSKLPPRYGLMLLWRYWEQRSVREIASATGVTEKSVERVLARARARFKELWDEG